MNFSTIAACLVLFVAVSDVIAQFGGIRQNCLCRPEDFCIERPNGQLICQRSTGAFYAPLSSQSARPVVQTVLRQGLVNEGLLRGLNRGLVNQGLVNHGLVKQGLFNQGLVKQGLVKQGLVNQGLIKQGLVNQGLINQGLVNQGLVNQGLIKQGLVKQGIVNQGLIKQGLVNQGLFNQGLVKQGLVKQGLIKQGLANQGLVNQGFVKQGIVNQRHLNTAILGQALVNQKGVQSRFLGVNALLSDNQCCETRDYFTCIVDGYTGPAHYVGGSTCTKYYFDSNTQTCVETTMYSRCAKTIRNAFATREACLAKCGGSVAY